MSVADDALALAAAAYGAGALGTNPGSLGWRIGFLGDSITNGSSAATVDLRYANQVVEMLAASASRIATGGSVVSGHPGYRSDQIAPFLASDIVGKCDALVTLQGTNDVGQGTSLAVHAANMLAQFKAARAAGLRLFVLTIPPRGANASPTAAQNLAMDQYNNWLRMVVPQYGTLVDIAPLLQNQTVNYNNLAAAYDSGDGLHPNSYGHWVIAQAVAAAIFRATSRPGLLGGWSTYNLVTNPYFTGTIGNSAADSTTGYYQVTQTGAAPTLGVVADTTGKLVKGKWREVNLASGAASATYVFATAVSSGFSVADLMALTLKIQIQDVTGNWQSIGPGSNAGTGSVSVKLMNQSGVQLTGTGSAITGLGYPTTTNQYDIGPVWQPFTVPASTTQILLYMQVSLPASSNVKLRVGEIGMINLTANGMASVPLQ